MDAILGWQAQMTLTPLPNASQNALGNFPSDMV